ncbi:hypothetical protein [Methylocella sp.]|uniref:hypothetical protein n=1 Tax=Methylocella sp. TaxID=1978226 RepID=UPI003783EB6E
MSAQAAVSIQGVSLAAGQAVMRRFFATLRKKIARAGGPRRFGAAPAFEFR